MQLDIQTLLLAGGVPENVAQAASGARKLELDLFVEDQHRASGPSLKVDGLLIVLEEPNAINWNRDEGLVHVEHRDS